jgi:hypothetical protein
MDQAETVHAGVETPNIRLTAGAVLWYPTDVVSVDDKSCQKTKEVRLMTLHNTETG